MAQYAGTYLYSKDLLNRPRLISFVAIPIKSRTSTIISIIMPTISSFGTTAEYVNFIDKALQHVSSVTVWPDYVRLSC